MDIADLLSPRSIITPLSATSKKDLLRKLAGHAARLTGIDEHIILDALLQREHLGTTGVGNGIALPHAKLPGLAKVTGLFARVNPPVDYEACDEWPVDLVFLILSPETAGADHLMALAAASRLLRDERVRAALRRCGDTNEMTGVLLG